MAEELAHGDGGLAVLRELGPVARDRRVVVEPAARVRHGQRHRGEALGGRHDDDHRVLVPRLVAVGRAAATPQIDDLLAAPVRSDRGADLAAFGEVALELGAHLLEARSDEPVDVRSRLLRNDRRATVPVVPQEPRSRAPRPRGDTRRR